MRLPQTSRHWKLICFILLAIVGFAQPLEAGLVDPKADYETIHTAHFRVHCLKKRQDSCLKVAQYFEEVHRIMKQEFSAQPMGKVEVVVTDQNDEANGFATVLPYNLIVLRLVPPSAASSLANYDNWLKLLVSHEYLHIVHLSDTGYPAKLLKWIFGKVIAPNALTPSWVIEGLATYYESAITGMGRGYSSYADMLLRTDIFNDEFLPLDKMSGSMYDWPSYQAGYIYGVGFWNYIAATYGRDKLVEFSHKYGSAIWLFSLNNKAKRVFGKYFYQIWRDWHDSLRLHYRPLEQRLEERGLKNGDPFLESRKSHFSHPAWNPAGDRLAYVSRSPHHETEVRLWTKQADKRLFKGYDVEQITWSPDGERLVFSAVASHKTYYRYSDLFEYNLQTKQVKRLTRGQRIRDASFGPDPKLVAVSVHQADRDRLAIYDLESEELTIGHETPPDTRMDHLSWAPDGHTIAASVWRAGGYREIVLYNTAGKVQQTIVKDRALNIQPQFSPDGRYVYYASDRSGIYNIYRYDLKTRQDRQITRVLSGAFEPAPSPDGTQMIFQYYTGRGYALRRTDITPLTQGDPTHHPEIPTRPAQPLIKSERIQLQDMHYEIKPYSAVSPALLPHFVIPGLTFLDNALFISGTMASSDPLFRHNWYGNVSYRTDANFIGYGAGYSYTRYFPIFVGFQEYAVKFGNLFGIGSNYYERRRRGFTGVTLTPGPSHTITAQYFFENREAASTIPANPPTEPTLGNYAGFLASYTFSTLQQLAGMVSPENSLWMQANATWTNKFFGASDNMQQAVLSADLREFLALPWAENHVLAFRQVGGIAMGKQLTQGSFALGGSLGESRLFQASNRVFSLRGLPFASIVRERALVFSVEYRMPLFEAERGPGTWPIFLNQGSLRFFADYGDAWNKGEVDNIGDLFGDFLLGVGAELVGHFVVGYHLPVLGRIGYGIIVVNRGRVAQLTDPILGQSISNGILILELGTSF